MINFYICTSLNKAWEYQSATYIVHFYIVILFKYNSAFTIKKSKQTILGLILEEDDDDDDSIK